MIAFIRNPRTWQAVKTVTATAYELPIESAQGDTGTVTLAGQLEGNYSRYMLSFEDSAEIYKILGQRTGNQYETVLTIGDWITATENELSAVNNQYISDEINGAFVFGSTAAIATGGFNSATTTRGGFAPATIAGNVIGVSASIRNYIDALHIPATEAHAIVELSSQKLYNYGDVLRALQRHGVKLTARMANSANLVYTVDIGDNTTPVIPFADGHSELLTENYNDDKCTCVVVITSSNVFYPYYIDDAGTLCNKDEQSGGYTTMVAYDSAQYQDMQQQALAIFAQNRNEHKIEFASDKVLHIGQNVRLILPRGVLDTSVNKVVKKSNDTRYYYTCGELPVTASDKISSDAWGVTTRLPDNPKKGTLYIEV